MTQHPIRRALRNGVAGLVALAGLVFGIPALVVWHQAASRTWSVDTVPSRDVALVFGAAMWGKTPSPYLQKRLNVAAALYKAGKTRVIIVSGSRSTGYSEPDGMKTALVAAGVPASRIVTDYGGVDTYSSCLRARDVFGVTSLIAVTQSYHLPRAVATCALLGIDTVGVGDNATAQNWNLVRYKAREVAGDAKLMLDLATRRGVPDDEPSDAVQVALR